MRCFGFLAQFTTTKTAFPIRLQIRALGVFGFQTEFAEKEVMGQELGITVETCALLTKQMRLRIFGKQSNTPILNEWLFSCQAPQQETP